MKPRTRRWTRQPDPAAVGQLLEQLEALGARNLALAVQNGRLTDAVNASRAEVAELRLRLERAEAVEAVEAEALAAADRLAEVLGVAAGDAVTP